MNGEVEILEREPNSLNELFNYQVLFQHLITKEVNLPKDSLKWYSYHIQAMIEEFGELMKADKRWKTHRTDYDPENKLEELTDMYITFINLCIFSGVGPNKIHVAAKEKIMKNFKRFEDANDGHS